jgi:hypothetical protein
MPEEPRNILVPGDLKKGFQQTQNTKKAAVAMGLGIPLVPGSEVLRHWTKDRKRNSGRPPETTFNLCGCSETWTTSDGTKRTPLPTSEVFRAYDSPTGEAAVVLDELIERIEDVELRERIKNQLPLSNAAYMRAALEQEQRLKRIIFRSPERVKGRTRSGGKYDIKQTSRKFARKIGADFQ